MMAKRLIFSLIATVIYLVVSNIGNLFLGSVVPLVGQLLYGKHYSFLSSFFLFSNFAKNKQA
ncbi:hypothetical protein HSIEG1_187 [Enterococcus sp. HSIEG1]|nr:hypothetical protein HSIEG1_187 [Enterococcus sp. HSIEG1]